MAKNIYYEFPNGRKIDSKKFNTQCNEVVIPIMYKSEDLSIETKDYTTKKNAEEIIKKYPDSIKVYNFTQFNEKEKKLYNAKIYYMIGKRSVPIFTKKDFSYCTPCSNTNSNYWVKIELQVNNYKREFEVYIESVDFTAFDAINTSLEVLIENILQNKIPNVKLERDEAGEKICSIEMYDQGLPDWYYFSINDLTNELRSHIVNLSINDFKMIRKD